jgi:hypothetical protein
MELLIANKLKEMDLIELIEFLRKLKFEDYDAFRKLKEVLDDI